MPIPTRRLLSGKFMIPNNVTAAGGLATRATSTISLTPSLSACRCASSRPSPSRRSEVEVEETILPDLAPLNSMPSPRSPLTTPSTPGKSQPHLHLHRTQSPRLGTRLWWFQTALQNRWRARRALTFIPPTAASSLVLTLTENIQLGIFGNYGDIKVRWWNPSGFGGGDGQGYWGRQLLRSRLFGATA